MYINRSPSDNVVKVYYRSPSDNVVNVYYIVTIATMWSMYIDHIVRSDNVVNVY